MALTEDTIVDSIDVLLDGQIQVRKANRVFRDGVEISKSYHRHVVSPGDDLSKEDPRVAAIGATVHTPEVIAAYKAEREVS
tara:strand:- start:473 stop:715 length:243 start_codon:yes stop_codon:yes gene_type:complete